MHLNKNLLKLHLTVLIWGFTAILGVLITKSALILVWYRMLFASLALLGYMLFQKKKLAVPFRDCIRLVGVGMLVALHWFLFYHCIKIATASVALVCLSSTTLFTSLLEPLINRRKFYALDILTGLVIIGGIAIIFKFESRYIEGTLIGLGAALSASLFTIFNSRFVQTTSPLSISLIEITGGFSALTLYLLFSAGLSIPALSLTMPDLFYLLVLSTVCTAMAYVMAVAVMKTLSSITVVLTTNLEPVYGILLAFLFFGKKEQMSAGFYLGALIILIAVFSYPLLKKHVFKQEALKKDLNLEKEGLIK